VNLLATALSRGLEDSLQGNGGVSLNTEVKLYIAFEFLDYIFFLLF
jgi:hypothetical protein